MGCGKEEAGNEGIRNMEILKQVLVTGGDGMVGSYFDFGTKLSRQELDVTDFKEVERIFEIHKPKVVIHLAAATDVDRCERDPQYAYLVNGTGTWNIAVAAKRIGAKVIYVSTVYVFDGRKNGPYAESDEPSPHNYYGVSKYIGEIIVESVLDDYLILRSGWMFGGGPTKDKKFVAKIMHQLGQGEIKAVDDITGSLTFAKDLVAKIKEYLLVSPKASDKKGKIIHVFNDGVCSRYDIAAEIAKISKSKTKVVPVRASYFELDASRSHSDKMISEHGGAMRPWKEALADYIHHEWVL